MFAYFQNFETLNFTDREGKISDHILMVRMTRMKVVQWFSCAEQSKSIIVENKNYRILLYRKKNLTLTLGHALRIYIVNRRMIKWILHQVSFSQYSPLSLIWDS